MSLVMGEADIVDELINPITPAENVIRFLNNERISGVDVTTDTIAVDLLQKTSLKTKLGMFFLPLFAFGPVFLICPLSGSRDCL